MRRLMLVVVVLGTSIWLTSAAVAGGWASVTLDTLPGDVHAGQTLKLGFMVRQHGQTPVSRFGDMTLTPYLLAVHTESKTELRANARQSGEVGHFEVEVTFPKAGAWTFKIIPAPFPDPAEIGIDGAGAVIPLEVKAALVAQPAALPQASAPAAEPVTSPWVWPATGGILVAALGLTLFAQRGGFRRRIAG